MKQHYKLTRITATVTRWVASRWFWRLTLGLFIIQSAYIALVGRFSMAFDEYYHLGSIQAYAKVWLPWSVQQPAGPATIGAVPADGSYLYHYLMSFPYRVLTHITTNATTQILTLRIIDVLLVVLGLYVFRRLLLWLGMSRAATQGLLWVITLLPMTPFLAGQITYDTLWFTMTGVTVLATLKLVDRVRRTHVLPLRGTVWTISLMLLTSQVKYAFLPMALAGVVFLIVLLIHDIRRHTLNTAQTLDEWRAAVRTPLTIAAIALLLVSAVFFSARYGLNMVKYHNPVPSCNAVLGKERCLAYGPFARDESNRDMDLDKQLTTVEKLSYPFSWSFQVLRESYFAVGPLESNYPTGAPLPVPFWAGIVAALASLWLLVSRGKWLWRKGVRERLLISLMGTYVVFLFANNLQAFLSTGEPVAIHGRYLLALLPTLGYLVYEALRSTRCWRRWRTYGVSLAILFAVLTVYGGGIAPFIIRSADSWYWPSAVPTSKLVRSALWPYIVR